MLPNDFAKELKKRQKSFLSQIDDDVHIIYGSCNVTRNHDVSYPFRQNNNCYYLTGFDQQELVAIFDNNSKDKYKLFIKETSKFIELWEGHLYSIKEAEEKFNCKVYLHKDLEQYLYNNYQRRNFICHDSYNNPWNTTIDNFIQKYAFLKARTNIIDNMRAIKSPWEIAQIKYANEISAIAHNSLLEKRHYVNEYQFEAEFAYQCAKKGNKQLAYPSIVAAGKNACTLHYIENNNTIKDEDLILIDAGCEHYNYASDITRTFPKKKFSAIQKDLYLAVLDTQKQTINQINCTVSLLDLNNFACQKLTEHLCNLKLITTSIEEAVENNLYQEFFPHSIGHFLGLDVHDISTKELKTNPLKEGMVLTIEPGLYIQEYSNVKQEFKNIGIRIEDNIVVTKESYINLSSNCIKEVKEIEL